MIWLHGKTIQSVLTEDLMWKHMMQTRKQLN